MGKMSVIKKSESEKQEITDISNDDIDCKSCLFRCDDIESSSHTYSCDRYDIKPNSVLSGKKCILYYKDTNR